MAYKPRKTLCLRVVVPHIDGVSEREWKEYIKTAVGGWKGGFRPEDPLFALEPEQVTVKRDWRPRRKA